MADYISRQAAIEIMQNLYPGMPRVSWLRKDWEKRYEPYIRTEKAIRELPSANVVEVVRCNECKHGMYDVMCKFYWCHGVAHSANWFCADGDMR